MDTKLKDLIASVARRLRRQRFIWFITPVCVISALIGFGLLSQYRTGEITLGAARIGTGVTLNVLLFTAWVTSLCSFRNSKKVAARIESRFPKLNQRLLTAVDQRPGGINKPLTYLQTAVIDEAIRHGKTHRWAFAVNDGLTRVAWLLNIPALLLLLFVGLNLTSKSAEADSNNASPDQIADIKPEIGITVEPGDTEIERGTNLVVVARFDGQPEDLVPGSVALISQSRKSSRRIEMSRNLKDPVFGGYMNEVVEDTTYQIEYGSEVTPEYKVTVFEFPRLERSDARLVFPEYTNLAEKLVEDTRRVVAVEGSELTWICHLNKSVVKTELVNEVEESMVMDPVEGNSTEYRITISLEKTVRWTLKLTDDKGRENKYPPELIARVSPNKPPVLKLVSARDVRVSPLEELEVGASFQDDYGMKQFGLSYAMAGSDSKEIVLGESTRCKEKREVMELIDFEAMKAEPDQLLSYYFWAEDVAPDGKPRRVQSDMFFAEVRHFEEIFRQGEQQSQQQQQQQQQSQNGQQAEELAELQKQIITGTWNVIRLEASGATVSRKFVDDVNLLKESQETAIEQLEELAENVSDEQSMSFVDAVREFMQKAVAELTNAAENETADSLGGALSVEQAAYQGLLKLRAREFEVSQQQQSQSKQSKQSSQNQQRQQQLNELELKNDENRYETEQQAQEEEDQQAREMRQVLNRLKELAQRQEDINKQLKQLQSGLEEAETEEEREEIERQLKRLREEQQELLRDTDELADRMDQPENQETLSEQQDRLSETRENVRESSEALEENNVSQALSAGTRAEREFKRMRDDVREKAAGEFEETMREMRDKARELDEDQQKLGEQISEIQKSTSGSLRSPQDRDEIREQIGQQKQKLGELLQDMEQTVEEAELSEPLLAENLYDSFRKTRQRQVEQKLDATNQLLERGLDPQASEIEESAREGISQLRQEIDKASENVLGDPTESLRRALSELDEISEQLDSEIRRNDPSGEPQQGRSQRDEQGEQDPNGQARSGEREGEMNNQEGNQQGGEPREGEPQNNERQGRGSQQPSQDPQNQEGQQQQGQRPGEGQQPRKGQQPQDAQPGERNEDDSNETRQQQGGQQPGQQEGERSEQQSENEGQQQEEMRSGQQPGEQSGQGQQPQEGQQSQQGQQPGESQAGQREGQPQQQQGQQNQQGQRGGRQQNQGGQSGGGVLDDLANSGNWDAAAPLTGDDYREWSDRLRDIEEMVEDPELRSQAIRIRETARDVRIELKRHSKSPQWNLVRNMIAKPLEELKQQVSDELLRRSADRNALVPIDRDPVPKQFADQVRKYYEKLGSGK